MPGKETEFVDLNRRQAGVGARQPGLLTFMAGYRRVARAEHFILASSWLDEGSVVGAVGADPVGGPRSTEVLASTAQIDRVEHFELVKPIHRGILDAPGAIIRVLDAEIPAGKLPGLLAWAEDKERELNLQRSLLAWSAGIRAEGDRHVACSVSAWASPLQIEQLAEPGRTSATTTLFAELDELLVNARVEHYQAIEMKLPEQLADAGGRRIIAARFSDELAASAALDALREACPSTREAGIDIARLGGSSGAGEQHVLVARLTLADHFGAERLIADMGGQVLYEADENAPGGPLTGLQRAAQGI